MTSQKILTSFVCFLLLTLTALCTVNDTAANEAYWADASDNTRLEKLDLTVDEARMIRLKAEVPAGKTLNTYKMEIGYDNERVSVEVIENDPENTFAFSNINHEVPGKIKINGFDITGVAGETVVSLITLNIRALEENPSSLAVFFDAFAATYMDKDDQFIPDMDPLDISKENHISGWMTIRGKVMSGDTDLCAMVLANGEHMFSCGDKYDYGDYELYVPLNSEGLVALLSFVDNFAPSNYSLKPSEAVIFDISMVTAPPNSLEMTVTRDIGTATNNPGWVRLSGTVNIKDDGAPLCAMVLANGQHRFTCAGNGEYDMEVPLNNEGKISLMGFADGFLPYNVTFAP